MLPEFGHIALILALLASLWHIFAPMLCPTDSMSLHASLRRTTYAHCFLIICAFLILITSFALSDFSLRLAFENSNTDIPLLYKITGAWGNHEGSMLLWVMVLAIFSSIFASSKITDLIFQGTVLRILGAMQAGLLVFILFTSNPFSRLFPPPPQGEDLNPLLQDVGLAIHPPMLYFGYVGFGIVFAIAIAALIHGRIDKQLAQLMRPWILIPWSLLTFGIGLGSWWAYRELGWGGFWFWDPVENASLLPWLAGTALLHSNIVLEKRGKLGRWVMLLAILTFTFSLMGTFLVRSGVITSVHSFASDPTRGVFILCYIGLVAGGGLYVFARRAGHALNEPIEIVAREGAILVNNLFLLVAALSILIATVYPMLIPLWHGRPLSIGSPYYNLTILPLMLPMFVLAGLAGFLAWVDTPIKKALSATRYDLVAAASGAVITGLSVNQHLAWSVIGSLVGFWLIFTTLHYGWKLHQGGLLRPSHYGMLISHAAVGLFVIAVTFNAVHKTEHEITFAKGESHQAGPYRLEFLKYGMAKEHTYVSAKGTFRIWQGEKEIGTLTPEERIYMVRGSITHESAIDYSLWRDLYLTMRLPFEKNRKEKADSVIVTLYSNPFMLPLWFALLLIGIGGIIASRKRII